MRVLLIVAMLLVTFAARGGEFEPFHAAGKVSGKHYEFAVTKGDIANTPVWSRDSENPALSPRRAGQIARSQLEELLPEGKAWLLREITLAQLGDDVHWLYLVTFEPPPIGHPGEKDPDFMRIIVLMNGKTTPPTITPLSR
jgi:hypothetical protein